jgi:Lrp/AsnC family transcriptional regulator for asnA, asnC and gidA
MFAPIVHKENAVSREIDGLDENIISMLQADGRRSAADIARELNIPRATVRRRIDSLVNEGFITIRAYANSQKLGLPIHVWIEMQVTLEHLTRVALALSEFKELRWIGIVSGRCNILAEGYFTSSRHLHAFYTQRLADLGGIQQVETMHVLSLEKFTFDWTSMRHAVEEFNLDGSWPVRDAIVGRTDT